MTIPNLLYKGLTEIVRSVILILYDDIWIQNTNENGGFLRSKFLITLFMPILNITGIFSLQITIQFNYKTRLLDIKRCVTKASIPRWLIVEMSTNLKMYCLKVCICYLESPSSSSSHISFSLSKGLKMYISFFHNAAKFRLHW